MEKVNLDIKIKPHQLSDVRFFLSKKFNVNEEGELIKLIMDKGEIFLLNILCDYADQVEKETLRELQRKISSIHES